MNPHLTRHIKELLKGEPELSNDFSVGEDEMMIDDIEDPEIPIEREAALTSCQFNPGTEGGKFNKHRSV